MVMMIDDDDGEQTHGIFNRRRKLATLFIVPQRTLGDCVAPGEDYDHNYDEDDDDGDGDGDADDDDDIHHLHADIGTARCTWSG